MYNPTQPIILAKKKLLSVLALSQWARNYLFTFFLTQPNPGILTTLEDSLITCSRCHLVLGGEFPKGII